MLTSPLTGGAVCFCGTKSTDSSSFPLTELTWVSRTVLSRVLASEALADQNELEARICWALPCRLTTKYTLNILKSTQSQCQTARPSYGRLFTDLTGRVYLGHRSHAAEGQLRICPDLVETLTLTDNLSHRGGRPWAVKMTQDLEQILSQLSQPDNAVIQQVTAPWTLSNLASVC